MKNSIVYTNRYLFPGKLFTNPSNSKPSKTDDTLLTGKLQRTHNQLISASRSCRSSW
jgi:hypothetical protein